MSENTLFLLSEESAPSNERAEICAAARIHNWVRLSELAGLELQEEAVKFLGLVNDFNLEGRYGEPLGAVPELT